MIKGKRIGIVGGVNSPISKDAIGGTEIWTYNFAERLKQSGCDVTLFAPEGSSFSGNMIVTSTKDEIMDDMGTKNSKVNFAVFSINQMIEVVKRQEDFDLFHINFYDFYYAVPFVELIKKPIVVTLHGMNLTSKEANILFSKFKNINYSFISNNLLSRFPAPEKYRVIYNGIDFDSFPLCEEKEDFYFFMGRISQEKGASDAVQFALKTKSKLIIAGPMHDKTYFNVQIKPFLNDRIQYVGELNFSKKVEYYKKAKAFLMPIHWEEPFGLVVLEAKAFGTPVKAYKK